MWLTTKMSLTTSGLETKRPYSQTKAETTNKVDSWSLMSLFSTDMAISETKIK